MRNLTADPRPQYGAWAPGGYFCICVNCKQEFVGDKRALSCADCAYLNGWRKIEDAPTTYRVLGGEWVPQQGGVEWHIFESWWSSDHWVGHPTHWRPLPEPPPRNAADQ
jgi:hypothetical protein